jgi:O-antigen ligase
MFLVVSTFNRGGMIAFLCGFFLFLTLTWKEKFFLNLKQYFKVFPLFFFLILSIYSVTKIEDTIQGRNPGLKQLERNVISLVDRSIEGSLSDNIFWRLNWWGKIVNYTFAGPYFWFGKGLGVNLALDDNISMDDTSDRAPLRAPHNFHLHILARYGVPVFILWLYFVFCLFKNLLLKYLGVDSVIFACVILCGLINASFDVALEGPMAAFPFWIWVGLSLARQQMPLPSPQDRS